MMRLLIFLTLTISQFAECHFLARSEIELPPGPVTLAQIGQLSCSKVGEEAHLLPLIAKLRITTLFPYSPTSEWKLDYLKKKWDQFNKKTPLFFSGATSVSISPKLETLPLDQFRSLVEEEIRSHLPADGEYRIEYRKFPGTLQLPTSDYKFEFITDRVLRGHLRVRVTHKQRLQKQFFINYKILEQKTVFIARETLNRGDRLNPKKLSLESRYIALNSTPLSTSLFSELGQMYIKRKVRSGAFLKSSETSFYTVIQSQQKIKGLFRKGAINIEMQVVALQAGKKGDQIQVKAVDSRKKFSGIVLDAQTVLIQF
jgi:flagella basal body P-ring formation protein FlgA